MKVITFNSSILVLITFLLVCLSVAIKRNSTYSISKKEKDEEQFID